MSVGDWGPSAREGYHEMRVISDTSPFLHRGGNTRLTLAVAHQKITLTTKLSLPKALSAVIKAEVLLGRHTTLCL